MPVKAHSLSEVQTSFTYEELIECAKGKLFGPGNAQLPMPNMLMLDRIVSITRDGGEHGKGHILAELDIKPDLWVGGLGKGRALGVGEVKLFEQVLPTARKVTYEINLKRVIMGRLIMGVADGIMKVDGKPATEATNMKVGLFQPTEG